MTEKERIQRLASSRKYQTPTFTKRGELVPSQRTRDESRRRRALMYRTHTPTRRDFRSPSQRIKEALTSALKTQVWPVVL